MQITAQPNNSQLTAQKTTSFSPTLSSFRQETTANKLDTFHRSKVSNYKPEMALSNPGMSLAGEAKRAGHQVTRHRVGAYNVNVIQIGKEKFPPGLVKEALQHIANEPGGFNKHLNGSGNEIDLFLGDVDDVAKFAKKTTGLDSFGRYLGDRRHLFHGDKNGGDFIQTAAGFTPESAYSQSPRGGYKNGFKKFINDDYNAAFVDPSATMYNRVNSSDPRWKQSRDLALLLSHEMTHTTSNGGHALSSERYPNMKKMDNKYLYSKDASIFRGVYSKVLMDDGCPFFNSMNSAYGIMKGDHGAPAAKKEYMNAWHYIMQGANKKAGEY